VISEVDLRRPGATYTVDTLADLRAEQGDDTDFFLLLGADALSGFATWHRAHDIARECTLVGITRPGTELRAPGPPAEEVILLTMPGTSISSTECRERFAADVPNIYLVPDSVIAYAQAHALYGGAR
jgi:nicotinate-nucleotide adenylyltransferase